MLKKPGLQPFLTSATKVAGTFVVSNSPVRNLQSSHGPSQGYSQPIQLSSSFVTNVRPGPGDVVGANLVPGKL